MCASNSNITPSSNVPTTETLMSLHIGARHGDELATHVEALEERLADGGTGGDASMRARAFEDFFKQATQQSVWESVKQLFRGQTEKTRTLRALAYSHIASSPGGSAYLLEQRGKGWSRIRDASAHLLKMMTVKACEGLNTPKVGEDGVLSCNLEGTKLRIAVLTPDGDPSNDCANVLSTARKDGRTFLDEVCPEKGANPPEPCAQTYRHLAEMCRKAANLDAAARYSECAANCYLAKAEARCGDAFDRQSDDGKDEVDSSFEGGGEAEVGDASDLPRAGFDEFWRARDAYMEASDDRRKLGDELMQQGRGDCALLQFREAQRLTHLAAACEYQADGHLAMAAEEYRLLANMMDSSADRADMLKAAFRFYCGAKKYDVAADLYDAASMQDWANPEHAIEFLVGAADAFAEGGNHTEAARRYAVASENCGAQNRNREANEYLKRSADQYYAAGMIGRAAKKYKLLGDLYRDMSDTNKAFEMYKKAADISYDTRWSSISADCCARAADVAPNAAVAIDYYKKGAEIYRESQNVSKATEMENSAKDLLHKDFIETAHNAMERISRPDGKIRTDLPSLKECERLSNDANTALDCYSKVLNYINDPEEKGHYVRLCEAAEVCKAAWRAMAEGDYEVAAEKFREAANVYEANGVQSKSAGDARLMAALAFKGANRPSDVGYECQLAANAFSRANSPDLADEASKLAVRAFRGGGGKSVDMAHSYMFLARNHERRGREMEARRGREEMLTLAGEYFEKAGRMFEKASYNELASQAYRQSGMYYSEGGRTEKKIRAMSKSADRCADLSSGNGRLPVKSGSSELFV